MKQTNRTLLILMLLFVALMSLPFLVPHTGFLALMGFVPLLMMEVVAESGKVKHFFWWYYAAFVLWNAVTTFWVCMATVGGGIFAVLANALQMALIFSIYRGSRKFFGDVLAYVFLALMWIAWEKFYFSAQISWPWLTLGNAFASSTECIQWYEYTGTLGGSLWVWLSNLWLFYVLMIFMSGYAASMKRSGLVTAVAVLLAVVAGPLVWSFSIGRHYEEKSTGTLDVVMVQPNFDPYQKFQHLSQAQQTKIFLDLAGKGLKDYNLSEDHPVLLTAPETFANDVVLGAVEEGSTWQAFNRFLSDKPGVNILFGASSYRFSEGDEAPSPVARHLLDGRWLQSYNSALMMDSTGRTEIYHKSKLVVGVELTPYPALFTRIDDKLGGVMGRCEGQEEVSLLNVATYDSTGVSGTASLGCAVCYESVYGDYCRGYVEKGAEAMTVITNDAWWGNTPGYRQHLNYSCLRAIELRRDIARCANTGITAIIDQRGRIVDRTDWWQPQILKGKINLSDAQTAFVRYGDIPGRICTFAFLLLLAFLLVKMITRR